MWPLLICSIISLTMVLERILFWLIEKKRQNKNHMESILTFVEVGEYEFLLSPACSSYIQLKHRDIISRIFLSGLAHREFGLLKNMEIMAEKQIERTKRGMRILDTIITIAPLLGILGTVIGIIHSFEFLNESNIDNPKIVAVGIAQALITTASGLTISILTLVPYNYLIARIERVVNEVNQAMGRMEISYSKSRQFLE